jgi:hypothetical protein
VWGHSRDVVGPVFLASCDLQDGTSNGVNGCFSSDPLFQNGYYLSPTSPCVNTGNVTATAAGVDGRTTRTDATADVGVVDLGYHYVAGVDVSYSDVYVATSGSDSGNNGTNAASPFKTITKAMATAQDGTRIHLAPGAYTNGAETFPLTLSGKVGVQLLGTNAATTVINAAGSNQRVLTLSMLGGPSRVEGVTLTGGNGFNGGGLLVDGCGGVTFSACSITNNASNSGNFGQGVCVAGSTLTLINSRIEKSYSSANGGGGKLGGGLYLRCAEAVIGESVVANNTINPTINTYGYGGGIYLNAGTLTLRNCLLYGNDGSIGTSPGRGDGLYVSAGIAVVQNCTIVTNLGQGINNGKDKDGFDPGGTVTVTNSIVWNNGVDVTGTVAVAYCDVGVVAANVTMNACISADPLFKSAATNDYQLQNASPCIDKGLNLGWMTGALDLAGNRRIYRTVDMGCYEAMPPPGVMFTFR